MLIFVLYSHVGLYWAVQLVDHHTFHYAQITLPSMFKPSILNQGISCQKPDIHMRTHKTCKISMNVENVENTA